MGVDRAIQPGFQLDDQVIGAALMLGPQGDQPAFIAASGETSHAGMHALMDRYARALLAVQVRRGQRVGVHLSASAHRTALCAAICCIGAVVVPLGTRLPQARLTMALQGSGARLVVHEPGPKGSRTVLSAVRHLTCDEMMQIAPASQQDLALRSGRVLPDHQAVILYGEGIQDTARGVVLSHRALLSAARSLASRYAIGPGSRLIAPLSLNHAVRLACEFATLLSGATFCEEPAFAGPASHLVLADAEIAPPDEAIDYRNQPGMLLVSGDNRRIRAWERALPKTRIFNSYVRAELAGIAICSDPRDPAHTVHTTMGRPLPGVEVMIVDPRTSMDMLLYEIGEVWIRGRPQMLGYHDDPLASRKVLDASGFFKTGDMGYLDSEGRVIICRDAFVQI